MFKVHYSHPPRKWDFYLGFLFMMGLMSLPVLLNVLIWNHLLEQPVNLGMALVFSLAWLLVMARFSLETFVVYYDHDLPKEEDVSHLGLSLPAALASPMQDIRELGFVRLGESQAYAGFNAVPTTVWVLSSPSHDISFELLEIETGVEDIQFMAQFSSWFEGNRRVETSYPFGDSIEREDYLSEGISTSLEATYHYHLRQMARFEALYGEPLKIRSLQEFEVFDNINRKTHSARRILYPTVRFVFVFAMLNLILSSIAYVLAGSYFSQGDNSQASLGSMLLIILGALAFNFGTKTKGRDISQKKKETPA